jgi:hypothetical protein
MWCFGLVRGRDRGRSARRRPIGSRPDVGVIAQDLLASVPIEDRVMTQRISDALERIEVRGAQADYGSERQAGPTEGLIQASRCIQRGDPGSPYEPGDRRVVNASLKRAVAHRPMAGSELASKALAVPLGDLRGITAIDRVALSDPCGDRSGTLDRHVHLSHAVRRAGSAWSPRGAPIPSAGYSMETVDRCQRYRPTAFRTSFVQARRGYLGERTNRADRGADRRVPPMSVTSRPIPRSD